MASNPPPPTDARELARWRNRLLPAMLVFVGVLTAFFMLVSVRQIGDIQERIAPIERGAGLGRAVDSALARRGVTPMELAAAELQARVALEDRALELRYGHAVAVLASRAWVRFMGFVTGMVLALVGAIFILGRLETTVSTANAEAGVWKGALETTSPGLVLAAFGTLLMLSAILVKISVDVRDSAVYLRPPVVVDSTRAHASKPTIRVGAEGIYAEARGDTADTTANVRPPAGENR